MKVLNSFLAGLLSVLLLAVLFSGPEVRAQVDRGAGVPFETLPDELRGLDIQNDFVPSSARKVGVIHALKGNVVVVHRATGEAYFGREGDGVYENDSLTTLPDSTCRIRFFNEDVVTMAANTAFSVDSYKDERDAGRKTSVFGMLKGKAMFYAMRLFRYRETRFRVRTPTVTVGVRGTKFGTHVYWVDDTKAGGAGIKVADRGQGIGPYLAAAGPGGGGRSFTDCHSEDGFLDVDGQVVGPGEMYRGDLGTIIPTPPEVLSNFDLDIGLTTETELEEKKEEEETLASSGLQSRESADSDERNTDSTDQNADNTNTEAGRTAENDNLDAAADTSQGAGLGQQRPTKFLGYFAGILTNQGGPSVEDVFVSSSRQDFLAGAVQAKGLVETDSFIEGDGKFGTGAFLTRAKIFPGPADSGPLGTSNPITVTVMGFNRYQEWGHWTMTIPFTAGGNYVIDNRGYFIHGETTCDAAVAGFSGTVHYSGEAYGTYWTSTGGTDMTGTFSTDVSFDSGAVSNFNMLVTGGDKEAEIQNASGTLGSSHFSVDTSTGEWRLKNGGSEFKKSMAEVDYRASYGSLYGPNGEKIGGAWGMKHDPSNAANGIFRGDKQ